MLSFVYTQLNNFRFDVKPCNLKVFENFRNKLKDRFMFIPKYKPFEVTDPSTDDTIIFLENVVFFNLALTLFNSKALSSRVNLTFN